MLEKRWQILFSSLFIYVLLLGLEGCLRESLPEGVHRVSPSGFHHSILDLSWCSDREIIIASEIGTENRPAGRLYLLDTVTHKTKLLVDKWGALYAPDCQPASKKVVYNAYLEVAPHAEVWILDLEEGSGPEYLTPGDEAVWAPDSTRIAILLTKREAGIPLSQEIVLYDVDTGTTSTVFSETLESLYVHALSWSPDGSQIAFVRGVDEVVDPLHKWPDEWSIVGWNLAEGALETLVPLLPEAHYYDYAWSPDGNHLALLQSESLGEVKLIIRNLQEGCSIEPLEGLEIEALDWSPDGRQIAFSSKGRVYVMEVAKVLGETFFESGLTCP